MWKNQKQTNKQTKNLFSLMSNLQAYYHFKLEVDQHTGASGKW